MISKLLDEPFWEEFDLVLKEVETFSQHVEVRNRAQNSIPSDKDVIISIIDTYIDNILLGVPVSEYKFSNLVANGFISRAREIAEVKGFGFIKECILNQAYPIVLDGEYVKNGVIVNSHFTAPDAPEVKETLTYLHECQNLQEIIDYLHTLVLFVTELVTDEDYPKRRVW